MSAQKPDLPTADSDGGRDEAMYRGLHAAIYELRLPPGTRLPEDVLSNTYGVSRTLVRKVLQRMAMEGLVEIRRNRGAQVAEPSADEAREVFATRRMLECGALAELPLPVPTAELQALRELVRQEDDAQLNGDRVAAIRLSGDFHIRLAALGGNATLTKLVRELVARSSLIDPRHPRLAHLRHLPPLRTRTNHRPAGARRTPGRRGMDGRTLRTHHPWPALARTTARPVLRAQGRRHPDLRRAEIR